MKFQYEFLIRHLATVGCGVTRLAAIIDPVYEKVARDTQVIVMTLFHFPLPF